MPPGTLADITEEEFRTMELIETERQSQTNIEDSGAQNFREPLFRKVLPQ